MTEGFTVSFTPVLTGGPKVVVIKGKLSVWGRPPWLGRRHGTKGDIGTVINRILIKFLVIPIHFVSSIAASIPSKITRPMRRQARTSNCYDVYVTGEAMIDEAKDMTFVGKSMYEGPRPIAILVRCATGRRRWTAGHAHLALVSIKDADRWAVAKPLIKLSGAPMTVGATVVPSVKPPLPGYNLFNCLNKKCIVANGEQLTVLRYYRTEVIIVRANGLLMNHMGNSDDARPPVMLMVRERPRPRYGKERSAQGHRSHETPYGTIALSPTVTIRSLFKPTGMVKRNITCTAKSEYSPSRIRHTPVRGTRVTFQVSRLLLIVEVERHHHREVMA